MQKEFLNVIRIDNGFILTTCIGDTYYCADEEAVASSVRKSIAAIAAGAKQSKSALTPEELEASWRASEAARKNEGKNE